MPLQAEYHLHQTLSSAAVQHGTSLPISYVSSQQDLWDQKIYQELIHYYYMVTPQVVSQYDFMLSICNTCNTWTAFYDTVHISMALDIKHSETLFPKLSPLKNSCHYRIFHFCKP